MPLGVGLGVLTLLALMLGSAVLDSSKGQDQDQDQDQDSDRGAGRSRRRWAIAVAAIAAPVSGYVGWQVSSEVAAGLPGRGLPLLAFGLALVALGGVLVALVPSSEGLPVRPGARPGPSIRPVAAAILAGALFSAAHGVATMVEEAPVDSAIAAPVGWPEPPAAPEAVRWETDVPGGRIGRPEDVVAAGPGMAVRLEDGVVALDGQSGEPRWHHRRVGARAVALGGSPSGEWVTVLLRSSDQQERQQIVSLSGDTGEVGFSAPAEDLGFGALGRSDQWLDRRLTDRVLLTADQRGEWLAGVDLADGHRRWQWQLPPECRLSTNESWVAFALAETVLVGMICELPESDSESSTVAAEVVMLALDDQTGTPRWRLSRTFEGHRSGVSGSVSGSAGLWPGHDASAVRLSWRASGDVRGQLLVDVGTGEVLLGDDGGLPPRLGSFDSTALVTLDGWGECEFTRHPLDPAQPTSVVDACDLMSTSDAVWFDDAMGLAFTGYRERPHELVITSWAAPDRRTAIEWESRSDDGSLYVIRLPTVTVAVVMWSGRLAGLQ
ncbi:hypothetical protein JQS43_12675 [Natronosporangium hydrolyticum]|uniref:Pyrrolo-quinoline quinone n=1 Tax=Natronosporangium hydrolyticum TaxID=2811111 RepID=A0A895YED0_9ACTN|nr:hypothetical protein [Natronosporangium hydrolyticum]QSB12580.1 hypothetical protein JQS43_12675 [Natronosporangium hydrolyticum]